MDIITRFQTLMTEQRCADALPLIEEIVSRDRPIGTSWYNYAACLEALGRFYEAVAAFRQGYELDPDDKGFQYRVCRALALNGDVREFTRFVEAEGTETPEIVGLIRAAPEFGAMVADKWFQFRMRRFA